MLRVYKDDLGIIIYKFENEVVTKILYRAGEKGESGYRGHITEYKDPHEWVGDVNKHFNPEAFDYHGTMEELMAERIDLFL